MDTLYVIARRSKFTQVSDPDSLTVIVSDLLAKRESFKVLCLDTYQDICEDVPYYEPVYRGLFLYPIKDSPEFKEAISAKENLEPTIWHNQEAKMVVPQWMIGEELEEQEWLMKAARAIKEIKDQNRSNFINRTLEEAPNIGTIDSIEQFSLRFPKENPDHFIFERSSNRDLIEIYGECEKWWKTGYNVPYFGNKNIHDDEGGFEMFPKKFYAFQRK